MMDDRLQLVPVVGMSHPALLDAHAAGKVLADAVSDRLENLRASQTLLFVELADPQHPKVSKRGPFFGTLGLRLEFGNQFPFVFRSSFKAFSASCGDRVTAGSTI